MTALIPNPKCGKCKHHQSGQCLIIDTPTDNDWFCAHYTESPLICEICGNHLLNYQVFLSPGQQSPYHITCENCSKAINSCNTCRNANICKFDQDNTIPEPAYVMQQVRQGPAIIQQQVKNPKRINLTCATGCSCYVNGECIKSNGNSCEKYVCSVKNW